MRRKIISAVLMCSLTLAAVAGSTASPIPVGSGANTSMVSIEFSDGNLFDFAVSYDGTATGEDLLVRMQDETDFEFTGQFFDFGSGPKLFVFGMNFAGSSDGENGNFDTSPVYYKKSRVEEPWSLSSVGASDRVVFDGSVDGWTFTESVIPEPGAFWMLVAAIGSTAWRGRGGR